MNILPVCLKYLCRNKFWCRFLHWKLRSTASLHIRIGQLDKRFYDFVHERIFGKWFDEKLGMLAFVKFSLTNENVANYAFVPEQIFFEKWHSSKKICSCTTGLIWIVTVWMTDSSLLILIGWTALTEFPFWRRVESARDLRWLKSVSVMFNPYTPSTSTRWDGSRLVIQGEMIL